MRWTAILSDGTLYSGTYRDIDRSRLHAFEVEGRIFEVPPGTQLVWRERHSQSVSASMPLDVLRDRTLELAAMFYEVAPSPWPLEMAAQLAPLGALAREVYTGITARSSTWDSAILAFERPDRSVDVVYELVLDAEGLHVREHPGYSEDIYTGAPVLESWEVT